MTETAMTAETAKTVMAASWYCLCRTSKSMVRCYPEPLKPPEPPKPSWRLPPLNSAPLFRDPVFFFSGTKGCFSWEFAQQAKKEEPSCPGWFMLKSAVDTPIWTCHLSGVSTPMVCQNLWFACGSPFTKATEVTKMMKTQALQSPSPPTEPRNPARNPKSAF